MDKLKEDISETRECEDVCEGCACCSDPEDAFWDFEKMTPAEKKEYLDELASNRSVGC